MSEVWKPVVGYEGLYAVSNLGRVRSFHGKGRILKLQPSTHRPPRMQVELYSDNTGTWKLVHRLVLEAFEGPSPFGMEGCHKDGDPSNNKLTNLMWGTHRANIADKVVHGTMAAAERHGMSKITRGCVDRMLDMRRTGCKVDAIARWFGLGRPQTGEILRGNAWTT